MDGLLVIDKPVGMTSHDVVSRVRRILKTKRVGHTGTLDPFATGLLVVIVGKATRLARFLDRDVKEYEAEIQFGSTTDTGDLTGTRNAEGGMRNEEVAAKLDSVDWDVVLGKFRGEVMQTPPMYSAKKVDGKKLYELARKGQEIVRQPVPVTIHKLELQPDEFRVPRTAIRIQVSCSAGTYIRTLAEDIGKHVGVGAHLISLRRTVAGRFSITEAMTLEALDAHPNPAELLQPVESAVSHLPEVKLTDERVSKTRGGLSTRVDAAHLTGGEFVRMTGKGNELIAIGVYQQDERSVQPKVVLV